MWHDLFIEVINALSRRIDDVQDTKNALGILVCHGNPAHIQETVALLHVEPAQVKEDDQAETIYMFLEVQ